MRAEEFIAHLEDDRAREIFEFWKRARGTHRFPAQSDLDLTEVPKLLPNLFILDAEPNRAFRYRFMGSSLDDHIGIALTGRTFSEHRSGRVLEEITNFFSRIIDGDVVGVMTSQLPSETVKWATYTRVGLPIADDHETPNKVLGIMLIEHGGSFIERAPSIFDGDIEERGHADQIFGML